MDVERIVAELLLLLPEAKVERTQGRVNVHYGHATVRFTEGRIWYVADTGSGVDEDKLREAVQTARKNAQ